tara:strand:- start:3445 stop:4017 length:573 start_codon:yes stop_codon:yes gene_type:complete
MTVNSNEIRVTVTRRSVMQVAPYESEEASSSVEFSMDGNASAEEVMGEQSAWSDRLATGNYESLGIGYEITEVAVRRLQKSVSASDTSTAVAATPARPAVTSGGSPQDDLWRDVMDNGDKWFTNWPEQLDGNENPKRPAYRRSTDGKGLWLTRKDGSANFPTFFTCPKTGKAGDALTEIGKQISQKAASR